MQRDRNDDDDDDNNDDDDDYLLVSYVRTHTLTHARLNCVGIRLFVSGRVYSCRVRGPVASVETAKRSHHIILYRNDECPPISRLSSAFPQDAMFPQKDSLIGK